MKSHKRVTCICHFLVQSNCRITYKIRKSALVNISDLEPFAGTKRTYGFVTSITSWAGTAYPSGAHEFTPCFSGVRVVRALVFCVVFCGSLFLLLSFFFLSIVLSFFRQVFSNSPSVFIKKFIRKIKKFIPILNRIIITPVSFDLYN